MSARLEHPGTLWYLTFRLQCFKYIVNSPPTPLTEEDIWFQIGHVHEQQKDFDNAKAAYHRVLDQDPNHAKVLQQLGWLHHTQSSSFVSQDRAIEYLEKSVAAGKTRKLLRVLVVLHV